ncbi:MAG: UPF0164 family protein [Spirochaetales bacterium]|nr:UPF0164 family protein [Spirochaetales bacterium]
MKRGLLFLLLILLTLNGLSGQEFSDYYGAASSWFIDENTGKTVFPLLKLPLGLRSLSMGTASTAVAKDGSTILGNPAGTSILGTSGLLFSHTDGIGDVSIESIGYTNRFNNLGIGISGQFMHIDFTARNSWGESTGAALIPEGVITLNASYNFLSSYYFRGVTVGGNLKTAFRSVSESLYPGQSLFSVMADIGVMTQFNFLKFYDSRDRNFFAGLKVSNLGLAAKGDPLPSEASAGFSYAPIRPLLIAFDFNLPFALYPDVGEVDSWYLAGGADLQVTDFFSMQTGFNYSGGNPRLSMGSELLLSDMSILVNYTLDLGTQTDSLDRFSLEATMNMGDSGRESFRFEVDQYFISGLEAYALGDLETAVKYWQAALNLDPGFQPAQEYMNIANETLSLYTRMEEMNRLR